MIGEWVVECDVVWCCCVRALRGKNKSEFLTKLKGVVTTFCDMIRHECPEGELIAPKYVSGHQCMCVCVFVCACVCDSFLVIPTTASYGATIFPFHIPRLSLCDEQEGTKVQQTCTIYGNKCYQCSCTVKSWHTSCPPWERANWKAINRHLYWVSSIMNCLKIEVCFFIMLTMLLIAMFICCVTIISIASVNWWI